MPANLDTLRQQPLSLIGPATSALASGGSIAAWRSAMEVAIKRSQTAAAIAGMADRDFGGNVRALLSKIVGPRALPKADRVRLEKAINAQLQYLDGFAADLKAGKLTMAQAQARANLYAGPTRGTYYATRYQGLPFYPTEGSECKANCKCEWHDDGGGTFSWVMGAAEHCPTCQTRAADNPYKAEAA